MKRLLTGLVALLLMASANPGALAAAETCISSAPNGQTLPILDAPSQDGPVIGGIGVGTCGIEVTNQCEDIMCVVVFSGLNGWADMRHISNSPVRAPGLPASGDLAEPAGANTCTELSRVTGIINGKAGTKQVQDLRGVYVLSGVRSTEPTSDQAACAKALDMIAEEPGLWALVEDGARQ